MPTKLVHGHELNIKVKADELKTRTVPELSYEFYGQSIKATEHRAKAALTGFSSILFSFLAVNINAIFLILSAYLLWIALKNQYHYGYTQSEVDDRSKKKWVRIDK